MGRIYLGLRCGRKTVDHGWRLLAAWRSGVRRMNEVTARMARLVLGWVTVFGRLYHLGM